MEFYKDKDTFIIPKELKDSIIEKDLVLKGIIESGSIQIYGDCEVVQQSPLTIRNKDIIFRLLSEDICELPIFCVIHMPNPSFLSSLKDFERTFNSFEKGYYLTITGDMVTISGIELLFVKNINRNRR